MKSIHFIGIEGVGTSAAAQILLDFGLKVSGSDLAPGNFSQVLYRNGAIICRGHQRGNLSPHTDTVVASAAIMENNPELVEARKRGIPILRYAELLGWMMDQKQGLAVAGTHGKTTTSALLAYTLALAGLNPSFVIGGNVPQLNGNGRSGEGNYFIAEACEYKRSFLHLRPQMAIVTNIDQDHLDYYRDYQEIQEAFGQFASQIHADGALVVEKSASAAVASHANCPVITYSTREQADWKAQIVKRNHRETSFFVTHHGRLFGLFKTSLAGEHNVANSLSVIALSHQLGVPKDKIKQGIATYKGVKRRFEVLTNEPVTVVDDYAHHPTEVEAVLKAARGRFPKRKLFCIFQPHQASRTYHFLTEFALALELADEVIVPDIYYARDSEEERSRVSSADLVAKIRARNNQARYIAGFDHIIEFLEIHLRPGDVVLCLGAGNITQFAHDLANNVRMRKEV